MSTGVIQVKQITVSAYSYKFKIQKYIEQRIGTLEKEKYRPDIKVGDKGDAVLVNCSFPKEMTELKQRRYFKEYIINPVAQAMVDIIENEFAATYANKVMRSKYNFNEIMVMEIMKDPEETQKLLQPIITEMMGKKDFSLDGWIRFRLADYKVHITQMTGNLIDEYRAYQEHQEFIILLKEFISAQKSLLDLAHIIPGHEGEINLYNGRHEKITVMNEDEYDDLILGTLLKIVPKQIMIHGAERCGNIKLMNTIKSIYEDRVTFCRGCEICEKPSRSKQIIKGLKDILTLKKL